MMGCATGVVKEVNYRGSEEEVRNDLYGVFPVGTHRAEVVSLTKSALVLQDSDWGADDREKPSRYHGTRPIYSWIEIKLAGYHSIDTLFLFETWVVAEFYFDEDGRLFEITVEKLVDAL